MNSSVHVVRASGDVVGMGGTPVGASEAAAWLSARGLGGLAKRWDVSIVLPGADVTTRLHLAIAHDEWGFIFHHGAATTSIRVTDAPRVHDRDDFNLLASAPRLRDMGAFVQSLEDRYELTFDRRAATIYTTI